MTQAVGETWNFGTISDNPMIEVSSTPTIVELGTHNYEGTATLLNTYQASQRATSTTVPFTIRVYSECLDSPTSFDT